MYPTRLVLFRLASIGSACAAVYHLGALALPRFAAVAYSSTYPSWRHLLFIAIDTAVAGLLLYRPRWLIWPYAALAVQQGSSHGVAAWMMWLHDGRIDWISVIDVLGVSLVLALLFVDWRERRAV